MAAFLRLLAEEIETNEDLAKKLYQPFFVAAKVPQKTSQTRKKKVQKAPFNPFEVYAGSGEVGLRVKLNEYEEAAVFKAILDDYALDTTRSYKRWRKKERFIEFIVKRVKAIADKGKVFR